jgi:ABC-type Fe3+/spermidine/putrescine transport system ATPase subunit
LSRTAIISGAIFAFAVSIDDVSVSIMLTDAQTYTLPIALVSSMRANFDRSIAAASVMLMGLTLLLIVILERSVGINRAVLLDEPLSALDAKLREELRLGLKQIVLSVGSTTIVVTDDQDEAMSLADRIIVMNRGRIEQEGSPDDIYMRPQTAFVASFIGRANWFHGRFAGQSADGCSNFVTEAGTSLKIGCGQAEAGGLWSVCVRPERMIISGSRDAGSDNLLGGRVADVVNMGAEVQYIIDSPEGRLLAVVPNRVGIRVQRGSRHICVFMPTIASCCREGVSVRAVMR